MDVRSYGSIVEYRKGIVLMANDGNSVNIKQSACNVGASAESSYFQSVLAFVALKLREQVFIIEITVIC